MRDSPLLVPSIKLMSFEFRESLRHSGSCQTLVLTRWPQLKCKIIVSCANYNSYSSNARSTQENRCLVAHEAVP